MVVHRLQLQLRRRDVGYLQDHSSDRIEHERAQLLHTGFAPGEKVESALEGFALWRVAGRGIAKFIILTGEEQLLELPVQTLAGFKARFA